MILSLLMMVALVHMVNISIKKATGLGISEFMLHKETVIELNGVKIKAFPSHHLDAMRSLPNLSLILLDEAHFFPPGQLMLLAIDLQRHKEES